MTLNYTNELTIATPVTNLEASVKWYTEVLGFELLYSMDEMGWAEVKSAVPGVNIGLSQVEDHKAGGATPTFSVKDLASARASLEGQGVAFDGETITIAGMVALATFFDPDGNSLMFSQTLSNG